MAIIAPALAKSSESYSPRPEDEEDEDDVTEPVDALSQLGVKVNPSADYPPRSEGI